MVHLKNTFKSRASRHALMVMAACMLLAACKDTRLGESSAAGKAVAREVIGDLGGVPVRIPIQFAESVEYDDDPGILKSRISPAPERTFSSKLRSFGFTFRYPDMAGPDSSDEARKDRAASLPGNTQWIFVGLTTGQYYHAAGSVDRMSSATISSPEPATRASYRLAAEKTCGLETYVLAGNDASGVPHREHSVAEDIFVARNAAGAAETYIRCSNRTVRGAPCTHYFDMEPQIRALVYVSYRRGLLCEWRGIQSGTSALISSFRAVPASK
jgi:hypothetical protein